MALAQIVATAGFIVTLASGARDGRDEGDGWDGRSQATDSATVAALLNAVRGADPVLCELAARTVESQWGWRHAGDARGPRDASVRAVMVLVNERRADLSAVPLLAAALGDEDACVRRVAAPVLGRIEHPSALMALRQALRASAPATREAAAFGLGYAEDPAAIPALLSGLQDDAPRVRAASAWALGEIEDARAVGALIRVLREDRDESVRAAAARALGQILG